MASASLIEHLQNPALYPHAVERFQVIETHISWVILTGEYAYKIKKPVDFGFIDYTTLAQRQQYALLELELNRLLAPELYVDVVAIRGSETSPSLCGDEAIIEYAVKMREFSQALLFDHLLAEKQLTDRDIQATAHALADFHAQADQDTTTEFGTWQQIQEPVQQNFSQCQEFITAACEDNQQWLDQSTAATTLTLLTTLEKWAQAQHQQHQALFEARKADGFIRACHGDVHLGNIVRWQGEPRLFDCIEFNESFRWTDTMADLGFLLMDLKQRGQARWAQQLVDAYFAQSGDYQGLTILAYYANYRAMVRAKVALITMLQQTETASQQQCWQQANEFLQLAHAFTQQSQPHLLICHGISGCGKSTLASHCVAEQGFISLSSDRERKRLAGLDPAANSQSSLIGGIYTPEYTEKNYQRLQQLATLALQAGYPVIIDACCLRQSERTCFLQLADKLNLSALIVSLQASAEQCEARIIQRNENGNTISEARAEVVRWQLANQEPLTAEEQACAVVIDTSNPQEIQAFLPILRERLFEKICI